VRALALLLLLPSIALAQPIPPLAVDPAEAAAQEAHRVNESLCARAASLETTDAASELGQVVQVWSDVSATWDKTGKTFLLYWRGVLGQCIGQDDRAYVDLLGFTRDQSNEALFSALMDDARRRLRVLRLQGVGSAVGRVLRPRRAGPPLLQVGVGGSYQLALDPPAPFHYGTIGIDVSVRIVGPLRVMAFARPSISGVNLTVEGSLPLEERRSRSVIVPFGVGPHLRLGSPQKVSPSVAVLGHFAVNSDVDGVRFLPGVALHAGIDLPFGQTPIALRPFVEIGNLARLFVLRGGATVVVSI